ncbi:GNAT family N-acetyltransferase [Halobacteriaceae archaeon GCM10025711]
MTVIRPERPADAPAIRDVVTAAFDARDEADLVDALRDSPAFVPGLSLVAVDGDDVVGHVLFSELAVSGPADALVLAPLAVTPDRQGQGVGSDLVATGLDRARVLGYDLVFLHGSPAFYPRFGFEPAAAAGVENPFPVPDEEFMAVELTPGALSEAAGALTYPAAFDAL